MAHVEFSHPAQENSLQGAAKLKYKFREHFRRYNAWLIKQSKPPLTEEQMVPESGVFDGFNFMSQE